MSARIMNMTVLIDVVFSIMHGALEVLIITSMAAQACIQYTQSMGLPQSPILRALCAMSSVLQNIVVWISYFALLLTPVLLGSWMFCVYHDSYSTPWRLVPVQVQAHSGGRRSVSYRFMDMQRRAGGDGWWLEESSGEEDSTSDSDASSD